MEDLDKSPVAGTVGYAIRGERRAGPDTSLLFCTTGVVLRRLGSGDPDLKGVSHVIVDEAHERGVDTDLLICLLRDLLERNKTIKVILMSATINGESKGVGGQLINVRKVANNMMFFRANLYWRVI